MCVCVCAAWASRSYFCGSGAGGEGSAVLPRRLSRKQQRVKNLFIGWAKEIFHNGAPILKKQRPLSLGRGGVCVYICPIKYILAVPSLLFYSVFLKQRVSL